MVNVDLAISVGIWVAGVGMSLVGIEMTITPPDKDHPSRKWLYRSSVIVLGVAFVGLSIWQSERDSTRQRSDQTAHTQEVLGYQGNIKYMQGQLDSIALMVGKGGVSNNASDAALLASAIKHIAVNGGVPSDSPHVIGIEAPQPGNFTVPHGLGCYPSAAVVQMNSAGLIYFQSPKEYDATNLYLAASDSKLTAQILIWCQQ